MGTAKYNLTKQYLTERYTHIPLTSLKPRNKKNLLRKSYKKHSKYILLVPALSATPVLLRLIGTDAGSAPEEALRLTFLSPKINRQPGCFQYRKQGTLWCST
jgi:hypothetical protein